MGGGGKGSCGTLKANRLLVKLGFHRINIRGPKPGEISLCSTGHVREICSTKHLAAMILVDSAINTVGGGVMPKAVDSFNWVLLKLWFCYHYCYSTVMLSAAPKPHSGGGARLKI